MANLQKTVEIIFGGKDTTLGSTINDLQGSFGQLDKMLGNITEPLAKAFDAVEKLDLALAGLVIGGMALAIKKASEMGGQFGDVAVHMKASGDEIAAFRTKVEDYAAGSSRSYEDITKALSSLISKNVDYKTSLDTLGTAEKLAVATRSDLTSSATLLTTVMSAYGASMKDAAHYGDIFTAGMKVGAGEMPELAGEMGKISGIASGLKVPIETVVAALGALGTYGVDSATALGGLKFMLGNLLKPSADATALAHQLGIEFDVQAIKTKGLETVMWQAYKATGGNAEQMKILFGSVRGLNVAFDLAKDSTGAFAKDLEYVRNSAGLMAKDYDEFVNSMSNINTRFKNSFDLTLGTIGKRMLPEYGALATGLADIFKGIKIGVDEGAFDPLFAAVNQAGEGLKKFMEGVAKALPEALKGLDFSELIKNVEDLAKSFGAYFGDLDLTNVHDLHDFIQKMINGIAKLTKITQGMVDEFRPWFDKIKEFLTGLADGDEQSEKTLGHILAMAKGVETFGLGLTLAVKAMNEFSLNAAGTFNIVAGTAQLLWNGLLILYNGIFAMFIKIEQSILDLADALSGGLLPKYSEAFRNMRDIVKDSLEKQGDSFVKHGLAASEGIDKIFKGFGQIGGAVDESTEKVKKAAKAMEDIPDLTEKKFRIQVEADAGKSLQDVANDVVKKIPEKKTIDVEIEPKPEWEVFDGVVTLLGKKIPAKKDIKVVLDEVSKEGLLADVKTIQSAIEWKAKVDMSQVEAGVKIVETMFKSLDSSIQSSGNILTNLFDKLLGANRWQSAIIEDAIKDEEKNRKDAFEEQKKLIEAEVDLMKARAEAIRSGKDTIKVEAAGLEPALNMILWQVLKKIQIRANGLGSEFLLGLPSGTASTGGGAKT